MNWTVPVMKCLELDYHVLFDFMAIVEIKIQSDNGLVFFFRDFTYVTLGHKTSLKCQFFEMEIYI